jgi:O-antigen/teichoic acid export membrane protein
VIDKLRQLGRSSLIYGAGNYGVKLVGFFLIPVYTRYLTPADYGVLALVATFSRILFVFLNMGQSTALFRFYYDHDEPEARDRVIAGSLWIVLLISLPMAAFALLSARPMAALLFGDRTLYSLLVIGILTMACRVLLRLPFAVLRAKGRDVRYATWTILRTGLSAVLAIVFVVGAHMGVRGVLLSALIAEAVVVVLLLPMIAGTLRNGWAGEEMRGQLSFGLALVPAGLAGFVLDLSDRFFLKHYASLEEVGLYALGYRFGEIILFLVTAINLAWPQFVFSNRRSENAPQLYAYATTYYFGGILFAVLCLSMLAPELIALMATPAFHGAAIVVPLIAASVLCQGLCSVATIGITLQKRPIIRSVAVVATSLLNIGLNFLLIPRYGIMGAAWATLISFIVQATLLVSVALRYYPIPYEWRRLAQILCAAAIPYAATTLLPDATALPTTGMKLALLTMFPAVLWMLGFFRTVELAHIQQLWSGVSKRLAPSRR